MLSLLATAVTLITLSACTPTVRDRPIELTIFAAASLTDAFDEIATAYAAQNPDVRVLANYAGSSQLAVQLSEGATADVFASANPRQMQAVIDNGRITATPVPFATNRLTIIVPADNPAGIGTPADLARPGTLLVLALPGVPVRDYTDQAIANLSTDPSYGTQFADAVYANLVSEESNVRQVVAKVTLGEADAGIVYTSDITPDVADQVRQIAIPPAQNISATYPIAPLGNAPHPDIAQDFIDFVLSETGQQILQRWGFGPPTP